MSNNVGTSTEALFADFDAASFDDWVEAARASLSGGPLEGLMARSYEGIDMHPLPHADNIGERAAADSVRADFGRARPWLIANEIDLQDPRAFNEALKDALANGQTAITLGDFLRLKDADDMRTALADIDLSRFPIFIRDGGRAPALFRLLREALSEDDMRRLRGCAGYDPLSAAARSGRLPADAFEALATHLQGVDARSPRLGSVSVATTAYHDAGANAVQELAIALATGATYLRQLSLDAERAASKLHVSLGIGENFFIEVAKFRAIKSLWAQMLRAFGISAEAWPVRLHARGGLRNKTRRDPHVNLLRLTSGALAAALGGVDSICLPAFDAPLGTSDAFSRRLSRNLQLITQEEARLTRLIDPAGGAWHIEALTDALARRAWARFQDIEAEGGLLAALQSGGIQAEIAAIAERRRNDLTTGDKILVGANAYVNEDESLPQAQGQELTSSAEAGAGGISVTPLQPLRLADAFEIPQATGANA